MNVCNSDLLHFSKCISECEVIYLWCSLVNSGAFDISRWPVIVIIESSDERTTESSV